MIFRGRRPSWASIPELLLVLGLVLLATCAKKEPITEPIVTPGDIRPAGNRVEWSTDMPARGSVRYGFVRGSYDHMAYPNAAGRQDRALLTRHSVALLDLQPGRRIYFQTVSELSSGSRTFSGVDSFTASTVPTPRLFVSTMIDIGFGDSHLLTMPTTGKRFLIDSGGRVATASVETYFQQHGVTHLDGMLATHVHTDHLGGEVGGTGNNSDGVLASYHPDVFFDSPQKSTTATNASAYRELLGMLSAESVPTVVLRRGQTSEQVQALQFDPDVHIRVLNSGVPPHYQPFDDGAGDINNESIVLVFTYGEVRFVIGGDAQFAAESAMIDSFPSELEVQYAKVHHHGGSDANSVNWVAALNPRVAFIPTTQKTWSGNVASFTSAAVRKYKEVGAHVYVCDDAEVLGRLRTDPNHPEHNVSFVTDGTSYEVRMEIATQPITRKPGLDEEDDCEHVHEEPAAEVRH